MPGVLRLERVRLPPWALKITPEMNLGRRNPTRALLIIVSAQDRKWYLYSEMGYCVKAKRLMKIVKKAKGVV